MSESPLLRGIPMGCHRMPHRSLHFRGRQFPVCARCTGILLGYLTYPAFVIGLWPATVLGGLLLNIPALVDGSTQLRGFRESTNPLRLVTGLMSGAGQAMAASAIGQWIAMLIKTLT